MEHKHDCRLLLVFEKKLSAFLTLDNQRKGSLPLKNNKKSLNLLNVFVFSKTLKLLIIVIS